MQKIKSGDTVRIHYTGRTDDGVEFDSSAGKEPLEFTVGEGEIIPGLEKGVLDMELGEKKTITVPADDAYGMYNEELRIPVARELLPPDLDPFIGLELVMNMQDGSTFPVRVVEVKDASITVDANHPLAGENLTFDLEVVDIITPA
ncbi:MAG: peptidylprolyl isomerase [Chlorobi bacterium]|nr:peptidylprolyl isomerase [Chlorobiota bacterium]